MMMLTLGVRSRPSSVVPSFGFGMVFRLGSVKAPERCCTGGFREAMGFNKGGLQG